LNKKTDNYTCSSCEHSVPQWAGICPSCKEWNTLKKGAAQKKKNLNVKTMEEVSLIEASEIYDTGLSGVNRVLGGGLVKGSLTLLSGEPGVGKSTLLLIVLNGLQNLNKKLKPLYVSGEESLEQIYDRAKRLKEINKDLAILHTSSWQEVLETVRAGSYNIVLIDSIQTIRDEEINSPIGSASQVKGITNEVLVNFKAKDVTTILIGHKTKDGAIAGPKLLEHMVDTVVNFVLAKDSTRILKVNKNRFGPTSESCHFEMKSDGLKEVPDNYFNSLMSEHEVGSSLYFTRKAGRDVLIRLQAIVIENRYGGGKRVCEGIDTNRLNLLLAITEKSLKVPLSNFDIYIRVSWSEKLDDKEADLAIVSAILSSYYNKPLQESFYYVGELSLGGKVRAHKASQTFQLKEDIYKLAQLKKIEEIKSDLINKVS
jgi:DNA repair protein RadA/Sms